MLSIDFALCRVENRPLFSKEFFGDSEASQRSVAAAEPIARGGDFWRVHYGIFNFTGNRNSVRCSVRQTPAKTSGALLCRVRDHRAGSDGRLLERGGLAGALFVLVMFAGAFPNGSAPIKKLMPIRGQLSIVASILTLGHNAAYGKIYFVRLFANPASLPFNQLLAAICSVLMLIVMLPLFVTSFSCVRKTMHPKKWKRLQRSAYVFYGLLACHILLLTAPGALRGDTAYQLTVFVYGAAFLSYLFCRTSKALSKQKNAAQLARKQVGAALCCALASAGAAFCMGAVGEPETPRSLSDPGEAQSLEESNLLQTTEKGDSEGYQDGVYTGSAMGMNAMIQVSVTIENGKIVDVSIDSSRDDEPYFSDALTVIDDILASNSTQVDTVSGATYSSGGILDAVDAALEQASG